MLQIVAMSLTIFTFYIVVIRANFLEVIQPCCEANFH